MAVVSLDELRARRAPLRVTPLDPALGDPTTLLREVMDGFESSYSFLRPHFDRFLRYYRLYRAYTVPKSRPWRANVFVPIPFASVEHGLAVVMEAYSQRPTFYVLPREGTDYHGAKLMEMYLEWEDDDMALLLALHSINKEVLLYGTGWGKVLWDWQLARNTVEDISVFNCFPDPYAENVDDAEFIIHRALRAPSYIRRMARAGFYDVSEDEIKDMSEQSWGQTMESEQLLGQIGLEARDARLPQRIEVFEKWTDETVITVLNRKKVVRAFRNRYPHGSKPFLRFVDHTVPHEMLGIGELEVTEKLFDEINDIRNQRLDVVSLAINNIILASRNAGISSDELIWRPGQIVWTNDINAVKPLIQIGQGGGPALGVQEEGMARFDIQESTGNWGYNQGQVPNRREAATTVLALQRAGGMRFTSKLRYNEVSAMRRMATMRIANAQRFLPQERWIRITNQMPVPVRREDIQGMFDYLPVISTAEPKEAKRAQLAQIMALLINHPRVDDAKFIEWVLDLYNVREKEAFLLSDEAMAAKMMLQQAMKGGAQPTGNGQGPTMIGAGGGPGTTPEGVEGIAAADNGGGDDAGLVNQVLQGAL